MKSVEDQKKMEVLLRSLAEKIDAALHEQFGKIGFALLVFEFHKPGIGNYISNVKRADMVKALRETANRLEKKQDIPPGLKGIQ